jgi:hypothetical protein
VVEDDRLSRDQDLAVCVSTCEHVLRRQLERSHRGRTEHSPVRPDSIAKSSLEMSVPRSPRALEFPARELRARSTPDEKVLPREDELRGYIHRGGVTT